MKNMNIICLILGLSTPAFVTNGEASENKFMSTVGKNICNYCFYHASFIDKELV